MITILETPEFHQEWKDLIEMTGGDIHQLNKSQIRKPYKRTNHFQKWLNKVKNDPEDTDRLNMKIVKQMTGNDQINVRKDNSRIIDNQPTESQSIAQQIYNRFGKKFYVSNPHVNLIQPPTEPEEQDIRIVMAQVSGVSREQAAAALRRHDGDIVNAIFDLQH